ncbi:S8 family peptidase [Caulobacter segnis]|uniref:Peptidase S8 family protein n=1 Tax=Caulobacter segnis TaxID=88688 RepID=A0A2W5V1Y8_9CAUL|nr:S8 family peptidase [Caulobacter segnis]PZR30696.1 MAG: peptidase S8 family protein [Caulobacter segnis]
MLRPHLRIDSFAREAPYRRPKGGGAGQRDYGRAFGAHAEALKRDLATAWAGADSLLAARDEVVGEPGTYVAFSTAVDAPLPNLEWRRDGLRLAAAQRDADGRAAGTIFVPDAARGFLEDKLTGYGTRQTAKGRPENESRFSPVDRFAAARLENLWVDTRALPRGPDPEWWECWCWPDRLHNFEDKARALGLPVSADRLLFPERTVTYVHATESAISRLVSGSDAVAELRLGRDTAAFFTGSARADQDGWIAAFLELIEDGRGGDAPAVCLLDTGVNRAHPLLSTFLAAGDLHAVHEAWGVDDQVGHGTELAGLALYGDLTHALQGTARAMLRVSLESVKLLPPEGFPPNAPANLGLVTQQAVALPEIAAPRRPRVFCLALGQSDVSGPRASSWSAAIDQSAADASVDKIADRHRRLFVIAAGNVPDGLDEAAMEDWDSHEVEDPGQAWNALTVGGVTQKTRISERDRDHWRTAVGVDALSPYSKVSAAWARGVAPVKPEILLEAGNRAVDPADLSHWSGLDSLSLLTTGHAVTTAPLSISWATSAAAAQAAGMAAELMADDPDYWPETVRALLVHSAQWTSPMLAQFKALASKADRMRLARRVGYGRADLERARRSRAASLALLAQASVQPFVKDGSSVRMNAYHTYELPWPRAALAILAERDVRLRVTLSYFVDPNPSADAPLAPARYRSFGLRFDLRKRGESVSTFQKRINDLAETPDEDLDLVEPDAARLFGAKSVSAGSLHTDEWRCAAADLIDRDRLAVYPVGGWWKASRRPEICNRAARYSLVVTLDAGEADIDLYAEIEQLIAARIAAEASVNIAR